MTDAGQDVDSEPEKDSAKMEMALALSAAGAGGGSVPLDDGDSENGDHDDNGDGERSNFIPFLCLGFAFFIDIVGYWYFYDDNRYNGTEFVPILKWIAYYIYLSYFVFKKFNIFGVSINGHRLGFNGVLDIFTSKVLGISDDFKNQYKNEWYLRHLNKYIVFLWFIPDICLFLMRIILKSPAMNPKYFCFSYDCDPGKYRRQNGNGGDLDNATLGYHIIHMATLLSLCGVGFVRRGLASEQVAQQPTEPNLKELMTKYKKNNKNSKNSDGFGLRFVVKECGRAKYDAINWVVMVVFILATFSRIMSQAENITKKGFLIFYMIYAFCIVTEYFWVVFMALVVNSLINTLRVCVETVQTKNFFFVTNNSNSTNSTNNTANNGGNNSTQHSSDKNGARGGTKRYDFLQTSDCYRFWYERTCLVHETIPSVITYATLAVACILFGWLVLLAYLGWWYLFREGFYVTAAQQFIMQLSPTLIVALYTFQLCTNLHDKAKLHTKRLQNEVVVLQFERTAIDNSINSINVIGKNRYVIAGDAGGDAGDAGGYSGNMDEMERDMNETKLVNRLKVIDNNIALLKEYIASIPATDIPIIIHLVFFKIKANDVTSNSLKAIGTTIIAFFSSLYFE